jgi:hypothetical protein
MRNVKQAFFVQVWLYEIFLRLAGSASVMVVSNDTREAYTNKIGSVTIKYVNLADSIAILKDIL